MNVSIAMRNKQAKTYRTWFTMYRQNSFFRKKEIDRMLMEMIENQEKSSGEEKEQENGTREVNGVEKEESDEEDENSSEVTYIME